MHDFVAKLKELSTDFRAELTGVLDNEEHPAALQHAMGNKRNQKA
jgi:hypothetical protein